MNSFDYVMSGRGITPSKNRHPAAANSFTGRMSGTRVNAASAPRSIQASASQPRRNGPVRVTTQLAPAIKPNTLLDRVHQALRKQPMTAAQLASRFKRSPDAITATVRDLRKKGVEVNCYSANGKYRYAA